MGGLECIYFFQEKSHSVNLLGQSWLFALLLEHLIHFSVLVLFMFQKLFACPLKGTVVCSCIMPDLAQGLTYCLRKKCMTKECVFRRTVSSSHDLLNVRGSVKQIILKQYLMYLVRRCLYNSKEPGLEKPF